MIQKINSFWITFLNIYLYVTLQIIYTFFINKLMLVFFDETYMIVSKAFIDFLN